MTSKEQKIYKQLIVEAVIEGVTRALHTVKLVTYTPSPMSQDYQVKDSTFQVFEDLWEDKTISAGAQPIQETDRRGDLPKSSPESPRDFPNITSKPTNQLT